MNVPVSFDELLAAYEWVSAGEVAALDCEAYVSRATGAVHWCGEGIDEPLPEDIEDGNLYIAASRAYSHFKSLLAHAGQLDAWHAYEEVAIENALSEWCNDNGFALVR